MVLRRSPIIAFVAVAAAVACCLAGCCDVVSSLSLQQPNNNNNNNNGASTTSRRSFGVKGATTTAAVVLTSVLSFPTVSVAKDGSAKAAQIIPAQGSKAPDFELENSRGSGVTTSLDQLVKNGKWTVLYFYPGAFTSGCTLEARGFQRDLEDYRKLNTQIVGVSVDPVEKNAQFCSEEKLDFFMLSDKGGVVSKKYGSALSIPGFGTFSNRQTYIIDPQGSLRWIFTDVESRISRHSSEVLEKLTELEKA